MLHVLLTRAASAAVPTAPGARAADAGASYEFFDVKRAPGGSRRGGSAAQLHFHPPALVGEHICWPDMFFAFDSQRIFGRAEREWQYKQAPIPVPLTSFTPWTAAAVGRSASR